MTTQTVEQVEREAFRRRLEAFTQAARELTDTWQSVGNIDTTGYPPYLPSFDELTHDLIDWCGAETMGRAR